MIGDWKKNRRGGFIGKLIIFVIAVFLILAFFHLSIQEVINWFTGVGNAMVKILSHQ